MTSADDSYSRSKSAGLGALGWFVFALLTLATISSLYQLEAGTGQSVKVWRIALAIYEAIGLRGVWLLFALLSFAAFVFATFSFREMRALKRNLGSERYQKFILTRFQSTAKKKAGQLPARLATVESFIAWRTRQRILWTVLGAVAVLVVLGVSSGWIE